MKLMGKLELKKIKLQLADVGEGFLKCYDLEFAPKMTD